MKCSNDKFIKNNCFHFYNRVVDNQVLFIDDDDYSLFLTKFKESITKYPLTVFAYCLMPNHFHFFLRQDSDIKIYRIFNAVLSSYVQKFNLKYKRKGRLMGGPLQSTLIEDNNYFINLSRYIHLNPVKANLVMEPEKWIYSNYAEWIGMRNGKLFSSEIYSICETNSADYKDSFNKNIDIFSKPEFKILLFDNPRDNT